MGWRDSTLGGMQRHYFQAQPLAAADFICEYKLFVNSLNSLVQ